MKEIWNWFTSHLDSRVATSAAVGAVLGLVAFQVLKIVIGLAVAFLMMLAFGLTRAC